MGQRRTQEELSASRRVNVPRSADRIQLWFPLACSNVRFLRGPHLAKQERSEDLLNQIEINVQRLSSLVSEITAFHQTWSMSESNQPQKDVDLDHLVKEVVEESRIEAARHSVDLSVNSHRVVLEAARSGLPS